LILDKGRLVNVDVSRMRAQAAETVARLAAANAESRAMAEAIAPYVGQFCSGLAASPLSIHRFCGHARPGVAHGAEALAMENRA
jgi:hypothetical protein